MENLKNITQIYKDAEQNILSILLNNDVDKTKKQFIINHTCAEMFRNKEHKTIYEKITTYLKTFDISELTAQLMITRIDSECVDKSSMLMYSLSENFITSANYKNYLKLLHENYKKILNSNCRSKKDYEQAEQEIKKYEIKKDNCTLDKILNDYWNNYETKGQSLIKTYYPSIDNLIGGFYGGNFTILAGATGMGKTCMMLNLIIQMALNNKKVLLFSLEMNSEELMTRIMASQVKIQSERIRTRKLKQDEVEKIVLYSDSTEYKKLNKNIIIHTNYNVTIENIEDEVKTSNADIVFVDYLGLIGSDIRNNSYERVSELSRRLKILANETDKPIIALHQLSRKTADKNKDDFTPKLSDLRDSGKIEQDADFVLFVYRPYYYNFDNTDLTNKLELIVGKSRHSSGAGLKADLIYLGHNQLIKDTQGNKEEVNQCLMKF